MFITRSLPLTINTNSQLKINGNQKYIKFNIVENASNFVKFFLLTEEKRPKSQLVESLAFEWQLNFNQN